MYDTLIFVLFPKQNLHPLHEKRENNCAKDNNNMAYFSLILPFVSKECSKCFQKPLLDRRQSIPLNIEGRVYSRTIPMQ